MISARSIVLLTPIAFVTLADTIARGGQSAPGVRTAVPAPDFMWREAAACGAVALLIIARLHEPRYPQFIYLSLVAAVVCTAYGFDSGAWPLGFAMGAYVIHILTTWPRRNVRRVHEDTQFPAKVSFRWNEPTRLERLFGNK